MSVKNKDTYRFLAENENKLYGVVDSDGKIEADFIYEVGGVKGIYQVGSRKYNNNVKSRSEKKYNIGLMLKNTKTGEDDFYLPHEDNCVIDSKDADIYYSAHENHSERTIQVPKYSDGEILSQGLLNGIAIGNIPVGMMITESIMGSQTETKIIEDDIDSMNY